MATLADLQSIAFSWSTTDSRSTQEFGAQWITDFTCPLAKWVIAQGDIPFYQMLENISILAMRDNAIASEIVYNVGWLISPEVKWQLVQFFNSRGGTAIVAMHWLKDTTLSIEEADHIESVFRDYKTGAPAFSQLIDSGVLIPVQRGGWINEQAPVVVGLLNGNN